MRRRRGEGRGGMKVRKGREGSKEGEGRKEWKEGKGREGRKDHIYTMCPRSSYPIYIVRYYIKWVTTFIDNFYLKRHISLISIFFLYKL